MSGAHAAQTVGVYASAARPQVTLRGTFGTLEYGYGPWQRVSRLGIPLINETVIGLQDKDFWNRTDPTDDAPIFGGYFDNLIAARDAEAVKYYAGPLGVCAPGGVPPLTGRLNDLKPVINLAYDMQHVGAEAITSVGDVLRVDLGQKMSDFPNGRRLETTGTGTHETVDVVDTEIKLLFCTLTNDMVNKTDILSKNHFNQFTPFGGIPDGVDQNETAFRATFPYLAEPWQGFGASPHAPPAD
jgi:hypothetical protein